MRGVMVTLALALALPATAAAKVAGVKPAKASVGTLERLPVKVTMTGPGRAPVELWLSADARRSDEDLPLTGRKLGRGRHTLRPVILAPAGRYRVLACAATRCAASRPIAVSGPASTDLSLSADPDFAPTATVDAAEG